MRSLSVICTVLLVLLFSGTIFAAVPIAENLSITGYQSTDNLSGSWDVYDGDSDDVRNFTVWSLNGNELPVLYVPFEGSSNAYNATDYAGNDNGGSSVSGATYNAAGGYDGYGAYEFSTNGDYVSLASFPAIGLGNYTLMAWIKSAGTQVTYAGIFGINSYAPGFYVYNSNSLAVYDSGTYPSSLTNSSITDDNWHHVAFVREGIGTNQLKFYLDGRSLGTSNHPYSVASPTYFYIGTDGYSSDDFYGSIDDVRVFDYALSAEQVAAFAANESNKIVSGMTVDGQNWSLCVTPNDGGQDGSAVCSSNVTIGMVAETPVSVCQGISSSGDYALTTDLSGTISGACIEITANDVILDCQGYSITNNGTGGLTHGILVNGTSNVTLRNCSSVQDYDYGIRLVDTDTVTIDPSYFCDNGYGISLVNANNTNIDDSIACNNSVAGIYVVNSLNTTITNSAMYNNSDDFKIIRSISAGMPILMTNVTFDNPAGNLRNYTNIDLNDTLSISNEDYTIDWASGPSSPPTGYESVKDKYLNITSSTSMSIDSVTWNYLDGDAFGFDESSLRVYGHNGVSWSNTGATLDTGANTLEVTSLTSDSIYALMGNQTFYTEDVYGCVEIIAPGYYTVQTDIVAFSLLSLNQSEVSYGCIIISADNVTLDCQDLAVSSTSSDAAVVAVNGSVSEKRNNVTIVDCDLEQGKYPLFANNMENGSITNVTVRSSTDDGLRLINSYNVTLANSTARDNSQDGVDVGGSINIVLLNNEFFANNNAVTGDSVGLRLFYPTNVSMIDNVFYDNHYDFQVDASNFDSSSYSMRNSLFLPPSGSLVDYTNLSINDTLSAAEWSYYLNWSQSPGSRPSGLYEFEDKFVLINATGSGGIYSDPEITTLAMHYLQSEVSANFYNEGSMTIQKWNGSWNAAGSFLNQVQNHLALSSLTPSGTYGIFAIYDSYEVDDCMELDQSRLYTLTNSLTGAGISASPIAGSACLKITADNAVLDCDSYTISGTSQPDPPLYGILTIDVDNLTVKNCEVIGYTRGYHIDSTTNSVFEDNKGRSAADSVFYVDPDSAYNTLQRNDIRRAGTGGSYAFRVRGDYTEMYDNIAQYPIGIWAEAGLHGVYGNNTLNYTTNSGYGFYNRLSYYNKVENNTIYNHIYGIYSTAGISTNYTNNTIYDAGESCINLTGYSVSGSILNRVRENDLSNCDKAGVYLSDQANGNSIINNNITSSTRGILIEDNSDSNLVNGHTIDSVTTAGIEVRDTSSGGTTISYNTITGIPEAIVIDEAGYSSVYGNTISGSSTNGIYVSRANMTNLSDNHMFNNARDVYFYTASSTPTVYMSNMIFDNAAGNYQNYANVSMADTMSSSSSYYFEWTANSSVPPFTSFNNKYVNITTASGTVSIDSLSFRWKDSEEIGYDEANLEIWKHNGSWYKLNSSVDLVNNNISTTNLVPGSTYAMLEGLGSGCKDITTPGTYSLTFDASGAPYPVTDISYVDTACIRIRADNVLFHCNGFSIDNTGPLDNAAAIAIYGNTSEDYTNVTIENCSISDYEIGIALHQSAGDIVRNVSITNASGDIAQAYGIWSYNTSDSQFYNLTVTLSGWDGIRTAQGANNTFHDNIITDNYRYGIYAFGGDNFSFYDSYLSDNGDSGLYLNVPSSSVYNNVLYSNDGTGMTVQSNGNDIYDNVVNGSTSGGFYVIGSNINMTNNTAHSNGGTGFQISYADNVSISNTTIHSNGYGMSLSSAYNITLEDIHFYNNVQPDFTVFASSDGDDFYVARNMTFDNNAGDYTYDTHLYVNDTLTNFDESYTIDFDTEPATPPALRTSFDGKYVNISNAGFSTVSIDSIVWKWEDGEIGSADESQFELWKWNGSWSNTGAALDTAQNELSLTSMNPESTYGILEDSSGAGPIPVSGCIEIFSSGTYDVTTPIHPAFTLSYDYEAPYGNISPVAQGPAFDPTQACIVINASHVVFDCNGNEIDWETTGFLDSGAAIAIVPSKSNITVQNCPNIEDFGFGVYSLGSSDVHVINTTVNNSKYSFTSSRTRFSSSDCSNHNYLNALSNGGGYNGQSYEPGAGFFSIGCINVSYVNSTAYDSGQSSSHYGAGLRMDDPQNVTASNLTLYGNDWDVWARQVTLANNELNLSDLYILPDSGALANYTRLSVYDEMGTANPDYYIDYSAGTDLPAWLKSFERKYVEFAYNNNGTSTHYINSTTFYYAQGEVDGEPYNESLLDVYRLNDLLVFGFTLTTEEELDATLDTGANTLTLADFTPDELSANLINSTLGVMEEPIPITGCQNITSPGRYRFVNDVSGVQSGRDVCMDIQSDDVVLFFDGWEMSGPAGNDVGIEVTGRDNITIKGAGGSGVRGYAHISGYTLGVWVRASSDVDIDPIYFCDNDIGVLINQSNNTLINDTVACNNTEIGIYLLDSDNTTIETSKTYNNTVDLKVNNTLGTPVTLNMLSVIFDRPQGDNTSFTNMTINDSVAAGEAYQLTWTENSTAVPSTHFSFENKWVEVANLTSAVSIDEIVWRWNETEVTASYNESKFELLKYNGSWSNTGATLDTGNNTLTLTNMNPASEYGILEGSGITAISDCAVISSPGNYILSSNISGAPHYINPPPPSCFTWSNRYVCINVIASDVTIDCNGYTLTGDNSDGTTAAYGIYVGNDTGAVGNVTIHNCTFKNWSQGGIYLDNANNSEVYDNYLDSTRPGSRSQFAVYLNRNTNTTVRDNYAKNSSSSLYETCYGQNNTFRNNTAYAGSTGFYISRSNYTLVDGNNATLNTGSGYLLTTYLRVTVGNNFTNNYAYDTSSGTGFNMNGQSNTYPSTYVYMANNTVADTGSRAAYFNYIKNSTIENNTARLASQVGFFFDNNCEYNVIKDNLAENNTYNGFQFMSNFIYNNVTNNTARYSPYTSYQYNSGFNLFYTGGTASEPRYNRFENNTAEYNYYGIHMRGYFSNNTFVNNTMNNNGGSSFRLYRNILGNTDSVFINNTINDTISDTTDRAFDLYNSNNNTFRGNRISNQQYGHYVGTSNSNEFSGDDIRSASTSMYFSSSSHNVISGQYLDGQYIGIYLSSSSSNNTISDTEIRNSNVGSTTYGIYISAVDDTRLSNITIANSTGSTNGYGVYLSGNRSALENSHIYGCSPSAYVSLSTNQNANISNVTFDSATGTFTNYTRLSLYDAVPALTRYTINWTGEPPSPPKTPFEQKFVDITTVSGTPAIDEVVWHWDESELSGYTESGFELWKYNGSWSDTGATLDTGANTLTLTNMNPASDYGILEGTGGASACMLINSSGTYTLTSNAEGAPYAMAGVFGGATNACIGIASSNVVFDCDGFNITNNGTSDAAAIIVNSSLVYPDLTYDNITIQNCPMISGYTDGIVLDQINTTNVSNTTIYNYTNSGIHINGRSSLPTNKVVIDDVETYNGTNGILVYYGSDINITNSRAWNNSVAGIKCENEYVDVIVDNFTAYDNGYGVHLTGPFSSGTSSFAHLFNSEIYDNTYGFYAAGSEGPAVTLGDINITNTTFYGNTNGIVHRYNTDDAFGFFTSATLTIENVSVNGSTIGAELYRSNVTARELVFANNTMDVRLTNPNNFNPINHTIDMDLVFLNPSGTLENYTNLSLDDITRDNETYSITWTSNSSAVPSGYGSFEQKFVNISASVGTPSIDSAVFRWNDTESSGHDESSFGLWKWNGSWSDTGATLNTGANTLTLTSFNPASDYGILESQTTGVSTCQIITSPGNYALTADLTGAPNSASELGAGTHQACIKIATSDVNLDCNGYSISENGIVDTIYTYAVLLNGSSSLGVLYRNVTIQNCVIDGYYTGLYVRNMRDSSFLNNTIENSTGQTFTTHYGIRALSFNFSASNEGNNSYMHNTIREINGTAISSSFLGNATYFNNTMYGFKSGGLSVSEEYDIIEQNNASTSRYSGGVIGFSIGGSNNLLHNNSASNVSGGGFYSGQNLQLNNFTLNTAYDNVGDGFDIETSDNFTLSNNTAYNNTREGFYIHSGGFGSYHVLYNNTAYLNGINGFHVAFDPRATLELNQAYNNTLSGYLLNGTYGCNLSNNTATYNSQYGISLVYGEIPFSPFVNGSNYNRLQGNNLTYNQRGIYVFNSSNNVLEDNLMEYNIQYGIYLSYGSNNTELTNNTAHSSVYGLFIRNSTNTTVDTLRMYDHRDGDFSIDNTLGSGIALNMTGALFLNGAGTLVNYTNLSINDSADAGTRYTIDWTTNSSALPAGYNSFEQKFVEIRNNTGSPSIDSIVWHWTDAEAIPYTESSFELWKYNGSWSDTGATLNTGANTLTLTNMNPASDYGILENNQTALSNCPIISSPGTYTMTSDFYGAPNDVSELGGGTHRACVKIVSSDVVFDCNGYTIDENNTIDTTQTYGVLTNGSATLGVLYRNVTVQNCDINGYMVGAYIRNTRDSFVLNNNISNSTGPTTQYGIRNLAFNFSGTTETNNLIANNRIWDIDGYGIASAFSGNCTFYNNTIWNFSWSGISMGDNYQNVTGNYVHSGGGGGPTPSGFDIQSSYGVVHNNTARNITGDGFVSGGSRTLANYTDNAAYDNSGDGFDFNTVSSYRIADNTAHDNGREGFFVYSMLGGSDHYLFNNTAENNSRNGFHVQVEARNVLESNRAYNNTLSGILMNGSQYANLSNNTALENGQHGIALVSYYYFGMFNSSDYARLLDNNASGNAMAGLAIINSSHAFVDPSYFCGNLDGIVIHNATNVTLQDSVLCNNTGYGLNISESNVTHSGNSLYNNGHDMVVDGTSIHNMSGNLFLNPAGTLANYTNLSINDSVGAESYTINWTANSSALPAEHVSFEQKFLNISTVSGTPSIDSAVWSWTDTEAGSYDESRLGLWKWNGSWTDTGATLNTGANTLTLTSMNPSSDYGILEDISVSNNITECVLITTPGTYQLTADLVGAPIPASEAVYLNWACIKIASSDVHINCNGHTITNNGTADAGAIVANTSVSANYSNITLRNCPSISDYEIGVHAQYLESSVIDSLVVDNSTDGSFTGFGFLLSYSVDTNVTDNTISDSVGYGMRFRSGLRNTISGNEIYGSGTANFEIGLTNGTVADNVAYDSGTGFRFISGANNLVQNNLAYNNSNSGFNSGTDFSRFVNNTARENRDGFFISGADSANFTNSSSYNNTRYGFYGNDADEILLENFHLYANEYDLYWYAYGGIEDSYARNVSFDNPQGGFVNYTRLDFNMSLDASSDDREISFNWTTNSSALPANYTSFEQKFISITNHTDGVSIDEIAWRWYDSESFIYNESQFELWKWNGSWSDTGATLNTGANSLRLTSFNPASDYGILQNGTVGQEATLIGAQINETKHGRYNESGYAGNASTQGGNFTGMNLNSSQLTDRWAALYGTFDGTILLSDAAGINNVYSWIWNATAGGVVCVSTNSTLSTFTVYPAAASDIDTAWSFTPTASDSAANTFDQANCTLNIGSTAIANTAYADTGSAGGYITCAAKTIPAPAKQNLLFCAEIEEDGPIWNGDSGDFEVIVPTPIGIGTTETYYFYVNLD